MGVIVVRDIGDVVFVLGGFFGGGVGGGGGGGIIAPDTLWKIEEETTLIWIQVSWIYDSNISLFTVIFVFI